MRMLIFLSLSTLLICINGQITEPLTYSCNEDMFSVTFALSPSFHSAWQATSNCSLLQCDIHRSSGNSCPLSSTPCYNYQTFTNKGYCAPGILCSLLEPLWLNTGSMNDVRRGHTLSMLTNGKVLVIGGYNGRNYLNSCELYDSSTEIWAVTGSMLNARFWHTASELADGKILVSGGVNNNNNYSILNSVELYDPLTGAWSITDSMNSRRYIHTASVLLNGKVLVVGGRNSTTILNSAELYDPLTAAWTVTGSMNIARYGHSATLLTNGKVLVTGGYYINIYESSVTENTAELY